MQLPHFVMSNNEVKSGIPLNWTVQIVFMMFILCYTLINTFDCAVAIKWLIYTLYLVSKLFFASSRSYVFKNQIPNTYFPEIDFNLKRLRSVPLSVTPRPILCRLKFFKICIRFVVTTKTKLNEKHCSIFFSKSSLTFRHLRIYIFHIWLLSQSTRLSLAHLTDRWVEMTNERHPLHHSTDCAILCL